MTRRIPAVLGIVIVLAGVQELIALTPMIATMIRDTSLVEPVLWLYIGSALAQLATGAAIAFAWRHARMVLVAWTVLAAATFIFAREEIATGTSAGVVVFVELFAGPALGWLAALWAGDTLPLPTIPRAHLVSSPPADDSAEPDAASRFDLGVVLFGIGLSWLVGSLVGRLTTFLMLARATGGSGFLIEIVFLAHAIAVGVLAIIASRRLLDPAIEPQHARRAVSLYVVVALVGFVARMLMSVGYQVFFVGDLSSDVMRMILVQSIITSVLGLVIPLFLWSYACTALTYRSEGPPPMSAPARLAAAPTWAMAWIAPFLISRVVAVGIIDTGEISPAVLGAVGVVCAVLGVVFVIAVSASFAARRVETATNALRIARIASLIGAAIAVVMTLVWIVILFGLDSSQGFRQQAPLGPLVKLVVCTGTMAWALGRKK